MCTTSQMQSRRKCSLLAPASDSTRIRSSEALKPESPRRLKPTEWHPSADPEAPRDQKWSQWLEARLPANCPRTQLKKAQSLCISYVPLYLLNSLTTASRGADRRIAVNYMNNYVKTYCENPL